MFDKGVISVARFRRQIMRVISLVPSWTETLVEAGIDVVGRTRFCIHPNDRVDSIPTLGGTKRIDVERLLALEPDCVVLDQDENTKAIADAVGDRALVTHIRDLTDVAPAVSRMAQRFDSAALQDVAERWDRIKAAPVRKAPLSKLPGVLDWIISPPVECSLIVYLIWKKPLMTVSRATFIGSVLAKLGYGEMLQEYASPYPEVSLKQFDPRTTLLLFSSEPYPFAREREEILSFGYPSALVDGEVYSWFGIRSLRFLEKELF